MIFVITIEKDECYRDTFAFTEVLKARDGLEVAKFAHQDAKITIGCADQDDARVGIISEDAFGKMIQDEVLNKSQTVYLSPDTGRCWTLTRHLPDSYSGIWKCGSIEFCGTYTELKTIESDYYG